MIIAIDNKLISDAVVDEHFVCDLNKCKGVCCVEGDAGAPLEGDEHERLQEVYPKVEPDLTEEGKKAIAEQGFYTVDKDKSKTKRTPLIKGKMCAYATVEKNGVVLCGIEKAQRAGKIEWPKPLSCHLYPIRINETEDWDYVNYEEWHICSPACDLGRLLKVPVYQFLKDALIRKYGEAFYETLDATAVHLKKGDADGG